MALRARAIFRREARNIREIRIRFHSCRRDVIRLTGHPRRIARRDPPVGQVLFGKPARRRPIPAGSAGVRDHPLRHREISGRGCVGFSGRPFVGGRILFGTGTVRMNPRSTVVLKNTVLFLKQNRELETVFETTSIAFLTFVKYVYHK